MQAPTVESVLRGLTRARIVEVARALGLDPATSLAKDELVGRIGRTPVATLARVLPLLRRDELRDRCRAHGRDDTARARADLIAALAGEAPAAPERPADALPEPNDIVVVRQRQYLVEAVAASSGLQRPRGPRQATRVSMVCLDDDAQGEPLEVLWELELGARLLQPHRRGLGAVERLDAPDAFVAYLRALQWNSVTATDAKLFQAPFRAGIHLLDHQLTPLMKALRLPRANLFIADDVGLGKTIEAGLVVQELLLRQRVETILVVCPPSVALQWRDEMRSRFGLHFEIYDRAFVARRRAERGFAVNPWSTHGRFIVSYQTLRRPEHLDPLLHHLGERAKRSLLILDEAHTVAPASATKYAVDSALTQVVREHLAPRFENRLFLSATPHNGHSNSFAALLEILDPQRFTRGIPMRDPARLEPVMVRRLKSDLGPLGVTSFPRRAVHRYVLEHTAGRWRQSVFTVDPNGALAPAGDPVELGEAKPTELVLAEKLAAYTEIMAPVSGRARLVFTNLQKRLLSSVWAFHRTFEAHCRHLDDAPLRQLAMRAASDEEDAAGADDEALDEADADAVATGSAGLRDPSAEAATLRADLRALASAGRLLPDARVRALVDWVRRHQCPAAQLGGAHGTPLAQRRWSDRRLIVFTEYGDTRKYLLQVLREAIAGTDQSDARILSFHGGMGDEQRAEVQRAFNGPPDDEPVRILVATDAAREGINLQSWCADLFHFDVPWNPARLEQRNGRIDRTLQPSDEVRCAYFVYPQRPEDAVLDTLVRKVDTIRRELGSVGSVVLERLEEAFAEGIRAGTADAVAHAGADRAAEETSKAELETQRASAALKAEIDEARKALDRSRKVIAFEPDTLRGVLDIGLGFVGAGPLTPVELKLPEGGTLRAWQLPSLPSDWQVTLDTLRPPRPRDEAVWEWRKRPPLPVVFSPAPRLTTPVVHLHLEHPFVHRVLARFRAQGFAAHDLGRATVLGNSHDATPRVVAVGRLSLFGPGATRLHDELVYVGAPWFESGGDGHLVPTPDDRETRSRLDRLLREPLRAAPPVAAARLRDHAASDFARLWPAVEAEADARAHDAAILLARRADEERAELRRILEAQRARIEQEIAQTSFAFEIESLPADQRRQLQDDRKHMEARLGALAKEIAAQPDELAELYRVVRTRVEAVGLVYLWPVAA